MTSLSPYRFASRRRQLMAAVFLAASPWLRADIACAGIFGDHMVLQRDQAVPVWGTGTPGESVKVSFAGQSVATTVDTSGSWSVRLDPMAASEAARDLTVAGRNELRFSDVLVGEVWLCSGQSNMEKPVGLRPGQRPTDGYVEEIRHASHPLIRLYQIPRLGHPEALVTILSWQRCDPETLVHTNFSAIGYFFAREIHEELGVPVGVIDSTYGGTQIEEWMPPGSFAGYPDLADFAAASPMPVLVDKNPVSSLYVNMVKPLVPYALRGILWYQGESNLMNADTDVYVDKMRALVAGWRAAWNGPDLPFYYVQISPFRYTRLKNHPKHLTAEALPAFWEAQARALSIPHTEMVVTTDLVTNLDDIHPSNKLEVAHRLAGIALSETYGLPVAFPRSPMFESMDALPDGGVELTFRDTDWRMGSSDGQPVNSFTVAGADRHFVPATVVIKDDKLVLHATVSDPAAQSPIAGPIVAVRFGWNEEAMPNLVNGAGLPASPFRTDSWPIQVEVPKAPISAAAAAQ